MLPYLVVCTRMLLMCTPLLLFCTRMLLVYMLLVCTRVRTRMLPVCTRILLVYMLLLCSFSHDPSRGTVVVLFDLW